MSKSQVRAMTAALVTQYVANGGKVTVCEPHKRYARGHNKVGGISVKPIRV